MANKNDFPKYPVTATEYTMSTPRGDVKCARLRDKHGYYVQVHLPNGNGYVYEWTKEEMRGSRMRPVPPTVHEICEIVDKAFETDDIKQKEKLCSTDTKNI